jgi:integrase
MVLTVKMIEALKPRDKPYKVSDQFGLYLYVSTTGAKSWRTNGVLNNKQITLTYGRYPAISLGVARAMHQRRNEPVEVSRLFKEVAEDWIKIKLPTIKNEKNKAQIFITLERYVYPVLGELPIKDIRRSHLVSVVKPISDRGRSEIARQVSGRIKMIFDYAVDCGDIESHAAIGLSRVIAKKPATPLRSIATVEAGPLLSQINGYSEPITRLGLQLVAHLFVRTIELRHMRYSDIRFDKKIWVVPAELMKMNKPHVVPLSNQVLQLIPRQGNCDFVLESATKPGSPICENTLLFALYRLGYKGLMTTHGFRALASTVLNESGLFPVDVIERQLAHKESDKIRMAYNRAEYLDQRIAMMQWYSDWLDNELEKFKKSSTS